MAAKIPIETVRKIVLERELTDSRKITYTLPSGVCTEFLIRSLSAEEKNQIRNSYDKLFPTPPVVQSDTGLPRFDLEDAVFQQSLQEWNERLARGVLAATMGITEVEVNEIEQAFPRAFVGKLFSTIELLNGIQSDPLVDLVKEAIFAPEVQVWLDTDKSEGSGIKLTDTSFYRELHAMIAAGLTLEQWESLSQRHKVIYMTFDLYSQTREAYISAQSERIAKEKAKQGGR